MRRAVLALLLLASVAGCASPAAPVQDEPTGQIDGAVLDNLLRPFDGQAVYLVENGARDLSSPLGGFTFRNVPVGTYTVLASRDGYRSAAATVDVEENRITRIILQLIPMPVPEPYFTSIAHTGDAAFPTAGDECTTCTWSIPIVGKPVEFFLESSWRSATVGGDALEFQLWDDLGHRLFWNTAPSRGTAPFTIQISGADFHENATRLDVFVKFGDGFTTRPHFLLDEVATFYYGSTRENLFYL